MKKSIIFFLSLTLSFNLRAQTIIDYQTLAASGCNIFASSTAIPATTNGANVTLAHLTTIGTPTYSGGTDKAVVLQCKAEIDANGNTIGYKGTEYRISFTFKQNYSYTIKVNAACITNSGSSAILRLANTGGNGNTTCTSFGNVDPNGTGVNKAMTAGITFTDYDYSFPAFAIQQSNLFVSAIPPIGSGVQTILIRKITITETAPSSSFTLTPTTVNATCGTSASQTFTVTNVNNSPVTSYDWDLGSSTNGWLYLGNPAPQFISSASTSLTLTSNGCTNLSSVSVTPKNNSSSYTTLTATINMAAPQLFITGKHIVCNSESYTLNGPLPCSASINWSIPSSAGPVLQFSPNQTSSTITLTNQKWYGISTTLTAVVSNLACVAGGSVTLPPFSISNDNDQSGSTSYSYSQESCSFYNVSHPAQSGTITSNSSPVFVHQGCTVTVNISELNSGKTVNFVPTGSASVSNPIFWFTSGTQLVFALPLQSGGIPFTFRISGDGACYQKDLLFFTYSNNGRLANPEYVFSVSPNPGKDLVIISAKRNESLKSKWDLGLQWISNIYEANTNRLVLSQKSGQGSLTQNLNIANLQKGLYIIEIRQGAQVQTLKFLKE
jgi:hypothetical protein